MKNLFKSLKIRLFLWYVGSLFFLIFYFLLFIHYYSLPHGMLILVILFILLSIIQFIVIYKITKSITYLSSKMKLISSKNLEEKVMVKGEDEIGELAKSFNSLLDRLNQAFLRERQFIADVAHELKTPLATLRSSFEITLSKQRSNSEYKEVLEEAITETDQLSSTLKNILDLAWSETPNEQKNNKRFSISELIDDLYEITQKMAIKKGIQVKLFTTKNVYIFGFKDKLARALLNLIDNAVKYSLVGGKIELLLEKTPSKVLITVTDNGKGILEEDMPYIFNRFYRGSKTNKVFGAGLGLAIAKSIIILHQGEIKVKSVKNKGSKFVVILPIS